MRTRETSVAEQLSAAARATQARLDRARTGDPSAKPRFVEQQEARRVAAIARDTRDAERKVARDARYAALKARASSANRDVWSKPT